MSSKPNEGTRALKMLHPGQNLHVSEIHEENEQEEAGTTFKRHPPPNNNHTQHDVMNLRLEDNHQSVPMFGHLRTETADTNTISDLLGESLVKEDPINDSKAD